ncbi:PxKF domain-containing protein [uncultured Microbacterium sp.]|uniref:PxKF domain-containing protein n=1 Tax=uncultured Microbacterium sp. TaxID=191216 RepID=UPI0028D776D8|nr:PxKF domain-containing protein [uncultured Microbacterium sp.]
MLIIAGLTAGPAFAEDSPDWQTMPGFPVVTGEVSVEFQSASSTTSPFNREELLDPMIAYRPVIRNDSDEIRLFGFGTDFTIQGQVDHLWTAEAWGAFDELADESGILGNFVLELGPHQSSAGLGTWDAGMPSWSGHTITVFQLTPDPQDAEADPTATSLASVTTPGRFVAANLDDGNLDIANLSAAMGTRLSVAGVETPDLYSGLAGTVTASGLPPNEQLELWVIEDYNYALFQVMGGALPAGAIKVGTRTVDSNGLLSGVFVLPLGLREDTSYQMVAGVRGERYWPAGTWDDFVIKPTPPEALWQTPAATSGAVAASFDLLDLDGFGLNALLTFAQGSSAGQTTVVSSAVGPLPTGFKLALDSPLYVHINSTVTLQGEAKVCLTYDSAVYDEPRLFHYDVALDAWDDITSTYGDDVVCGFTTSFSPFALGYLDEFDFTGFFSPVSMNAENLAKPGQAIPVKFSLNGDQGLDVVTSARFIVEGTDLTPEGELIPATTAGGSGLSYDASTSVYTYVWKTAKTLSLKTGRFELTLSDDTVHTFDVSFKK